MGIKLDESRVVLKAEGGWREKVGNGGDLLGVGVVVGRTRRREAGLSGKNCCRIERRGESAVEGRRRLNRARSKRAETGREWGR